jgi:WS/DGAT/MGAT family acyltransferase
MQQLSPLDTAFLTMETPRQFGHVCSLVILDPSTSASGDVHADLVRAFEARKHLLGVYRRKLATVPLDLDRPYWVEDPDLDLDFHIRALALPAPGDDVQLGEQVARIIARPLDRSRPLWEWYVISGLTGGRVGVLTKLHHATIDGASGVELIQLLLETEADAEPPEPVPDTASTPIAAPPSAATLLARTAVGYATRPQKAVELQVQLLRTAARLTGNPVFRQLALAAMPGLRALRRRAGERPDGTLPPTLTAGPAPATPWNRAVTAHRRFAFRSLHLADAQAIKHALGVTVNDVVLAICASALRQYLADRDVLPVKPLVAMVPISVRQPGERGEFTNRVAGTTVPIHTDLDDPVARLLAIHDSMAAAKELHEAIPASILTDVTEFVPPALAAQASRLSTRIRMADRMNPPFNLTISNVPGPRVPLYLGGAAMEHFYPVSVVAEGQGLNMTVQSYLDRLDFGLVADRELVPDLWDLCDGLERAMRELVDATTPKVKRPSTSPARGRGGRRAPVAGTPATGPRAATAGRPRRAAPRR